METASTKPARTIFGGASRQRFVGRMGPWHLIHQLAEGPLTRIYAARHSDGPDAAPAYAVKALRREWWQDPSAIQTMRREAWVGRHASHANLISVLDSGVTHPPFYVVTPRLAGRTVAALLAGGERPALPQTLWIARQVCEALSALVDQAGVIHADVKPSNIMVAPDGHATLLDLGFCQTMHEARSWASRPVMGSLNYIAPEMVTSACAADTRSDLYSLGAALYEMLTGRPPFSGSEPAELIAKHRQEKPECVLRARPDTPKPVASLVHRLLAKDPLRRPNSPADVADELARLEIACFAYR